MDWLNLHIPTVIRSPEYVGSSPAERGTWLSVLSYACEIECGGRLVGAGDWKDRQWQQACGVTLREVRAASRLMRFDGHDLVINGYPMAKEKQVRQARGVGMAGAMARWGKSDAGRHAAGMPTGTGESMPTGIGESMPSGIGDSMPSGMPNGNAEGEGEGEGEGELRDGMPSHAPTPPALDSGEAQREANRKTLRREMLKLALPASAEAVEAWSAALVGAGATTLPEVIDALRWVVKRAREGDHDCAWPRKVPGLLGDVAGVIRRQREREAASQPQEGAA